jgi:hypothetical protein
MVSPKTHCRGRAFVVHSPPYSSRRELDLNSGSAGSDHLTTPYNHRDDFQVAPIDRIRPPERSPSTCRFEHHLSNSVSRQVRSFKKCGTAVSTSKASAWPGSSGGHGAGYALGLGREMAAAGPTTRVLSRLSPSCVAVLDDVDHLSDVTHCSSPRLGARNASCFPF